MKDPRRITKGNFKHSLMEIFFLVIASAVSGMTDWDDIEDFGNFRIAWFRKYFPYKNGIASHDTIARLFAALEPAEFGKYFIKWADSIREDTENEVIAIDGKRMCGSADSANGKAALHIVSAYASANRLTLGQLAVNEKNNEIVAIPELLDIVDLKKSIVTIDAMGCQKVIAEKIISKDAQYILALKGNQKDLAEQVKRMFEINRISSIHTSHDMGHGRVEKRTCSVITDLDLLDQRQDWKGLQSIIKIDSERYHKKSGKTDNETRYYISSLTSDAEQANKYVRSHWAIENNLHWMLDVVFKEDSSKKRAGNAAANMNMVCKIALARIEKAEIKASKRRKRLKALMSDDIREYMLGLF